MMRMLRVVPILVVLSTVLMGVDGHAGRVQRLGGRMSLKINSAVPPGGGFGFTWSQGALTLIDGTTHGFSVSGLWIHGNGSTQPITMPVRPVPLAQWTTTPSPTWSLPTTASTASAMSLASCSGFRGDRPP